MNETATPPPSPNSLAPIAGIAIACWTLNGLLFFLHSGLYRCSGGMCEGGITFQGAMILGVTFVLTAIAGIYAVIVALGRRDWRSTACFGFFFVALIFAVYACIRVEVMTPIRLSPYSTASRQHI